MRIIQRSLLSTDEVFNGDVSRERHTASVPSSLVQLIELILEQKDALTKNQNLRRISENIAQLIHFNSVKQKRRGNVSNFRHLITNEPPLPVTIAFAGLC